MGKETIELLERRRSVRAFSTRAIDKETLDTLKRLTLRAPSAGNMTMYSVIEVTDESIKEKLSYICDNQPMIAKAPGVWIFLADMYRLYNWMKEDKSAEKCKKELRKPGLGDLHLAMQDAIIAAQNGVIAAEALGLTSCYIGDIIENYEELRDLLDLPSLAIPACMFIFGYQKGEIKAPLTLRPDNEFIFFDNKYKRQNAAECKKMYKEHTDRLYESKILPKGELTSYVDNFCNKKYLSPFMEEMNRSTSVFINRWCEED